MLGSGFLLGQSCLPFCKGGRLSEGWCSCKLGLILIPWKLITESAAVSEGHGQTWAKWCTKKWGFLPQSRSQPSPCFHSGPSESQGMLRSSKVTLRETYRAPGFRANFLLCGFGVFLLGLFWCLFVFSFEPEKACLFCASPLSVSPRQIPNQISF